MVKFIANKAFFFYSKRALLHFKEKRMKQGFISGGKEYLITDMRPVRPLLNYVWNENQIAAADQCGFGKSTSALGELRRTLIEGEESRLIYIKNRANDEYYSPNRNFGDLPFDEYYCVAGLNYQKIVSKYKGLKTEFTITVPEKGFAEIYDITLTNDGDKNADFDMYLYLRPAANVTDHLSCGYGDWSDEIGGLWYADNHFQRKHDYNYIFIKSTEKVYGYDVSDENFVGVYSNRVNPIGLKNEKLSCLGTTFEENYAGVMQFRLSLAPGEKKRVITVIGTVKNAAEVKNYDKCLSEKYFDENLANFAKENENLVEKFVCETPDEYFNVMANVWLKRQTSLGKTWGRVYGKGFRDVMQDISSFVSLDGEVAREKIKLCLSYQWENGNPVRMFHPLFLHPYRDGAAWIPASVTAYIKETGDFAFLNEKVGYFESEKTGTVREHVRAGLGFLLNERGERNLVLWGGGDWNDSANNAGMKLKGESVWLSIATVKAVKEYCELLRVIGDEEEANALELKNEELIKAVMKSGFNGRYFIYGYNDEGEQVGGEKNSEASFYLNPQTWAVLSGIVSGESGEKLMDEVESRLKCDYGYKQCDPPYATPDDNIGRVTYFMPGLVENASVYNHGVAFKIAADCMLGRNQLAYRTFEKMNYNNPKNKNNGMEPYAYSNMFVGPDSKYKRGFAPMSWITGTGGWMYKNLTENILGIKADYNGLKIVPCVPEEWKTVKVKRIFRGGEYNVEISRGENKGVYIGENKINGNVVPAISAGEKVTVKVIV